MVIAAVAAPVAGVHRVMINQRTAADYPNHER